MNQQLELVSTLTSQDLRVHRLKWNVCRSAACSQAVGSSLKQTGRTEDIGEELLISDVLSRVTYVYGRDRLSADEDG